MTDADLQKLTEEIFESEIIAHDEMCMGRYETCGCKEKMIEYLQRIHDQAWNEALKEAIKESDGICRCEPIHTRDCPLLYTLNAIRVLRRGKVEE